MNPSKPLQARSRETERRLVQAAETVFSEKGFDRARVADIVKQAGSSTGNFYFRFKNKEMLFDSMLEQFTTKAQEEIAGLPADCDSIAHLIYSLVELSAVVIRRNQGFYRAIHEVSARQPEVWRILQRLSTDTADRVIELAAPFSEEINIPDWKLAIRHAVQIITGYTANQAVHDAGPAHFHDQAQIDLLYRAAMGVLGVTNAPDPTIFEFTPAEDNLA